MLLQYCLSTKLSFLVFSPYLYRSRAYGLPKVNGAIAYFKAIDPDALVNQVLECMEEEFDGYNGLDTCAQGNCGSSFI